MTAKYLPGWVSTLALLGLVPLFVLIAIPWMQAENARTAARNAALHAERQQAEEALRQHELAPIREAIQGSDWLGLLEACRGAVYRPADRWRPPVALAFHPQRVDVYFRIDGRVDALDRHACTADGVRQERVAALQAPAVALERDDAAATVERATVAGADVDWGHFRRDLEAAAANPAVQRVEHLAGADDAHPRVRWYAVDGSVLRREPADDEDFPVLSGQLAAARAGATPRQPLRQPADLLWLLGETLPAAAQVHRVLASDDSVLVNLSLDGRWQQRLIDAFGDMLPVGAPGTRDNECLPGLPPAQLVAAFTATCAATPGCRLDGPLDVANYRCGSAEVADGWYLERGDD